MKTFSLEICIWEPFGNWFGNYLGIIWELFGNYVSRRFLRALFFVASPRVLGMGGTPCACRLQERERESFPNKVCVAAPSTSTAHAKLNQIPDFECNVPTEAKFLIVDGNIIATPSP